MTLTDTTPEDLARRTGFSLDDWIAAREVLGEHWAAACETVAHLAVRSNTTPREIARILVGGSGYPGVLGAEWRP